MGLNIKRRLSWIPNLFTLGNLWLGFFACIIALRGTGNHLILAGSLIFLAVLLDGLDGATARLLNATSELGAQLDSLADLTTFGIAPGILMYALVLSNYNYSLESGASIPTGMLLAGLFPAAVAFRLARFNVSHTPGSFEGLPSPVGGIIVALMPLAFRDVLVIPDVILIGIYVITAYLMVSTIRYSKVQVALFRRFSVVRGGLLIFFSVALLVFVWFQFGAQFSAAGLFSMVLLYVVSGLISFLIHMVQEYRI